MKVKIYYKNSFLKKFKKLPISIQQKVLKKEKIFIKDYFTPLLKTHKLHRRFKNFYTFSIDFEYRIIFDFDQNKNIRFYSIGKHDIY
ncbi:MAG: type II toxin-antitoxin system mRNA interferase toxin, RelE/StbE family [Candidatus Pacebacteria bacterium]|nr:type II toxin-antitoxin system mRNA interferase toxin, RelE/StbE family [Candidatus Paceibacterota bacterium]